MTKDQMKLDVTMDFVKGALYSRPTGLPCSLQGTRKALTGEKKVARAKEKTLGHGRVGILIRGLTHEFRFFFRH